PVVARIQSLSFSPKIRVTRLVSPRPMPVAAVAETSPPPAKIRAATNIEKTDLRPSVRTASSVALSTSPVWPPSPASSGQEGGGTRTPRNPENNIAEQSQARIERIG